MSKSTPISQLPSFAPQQQQMMQPPPPQQQQQQQGPFVNDQHRQIVAQAQHAVQNYTMPQSSSSAHDISHEDEATIQETLQYISGPYNGAAQQQQQQQQQPPPQPAMQYDPSPPPPLPPHYMMHDGGGGGMYMPPSALAPPPQPVLAPSVSVAGCGWMPAADDVRVVVLGIMAYVLLAVLPLESLVSKYIRLDGFPYADIILKALAMGAILYAGKRLLN
jgi:hypothetical protein